MSGSERSLTVEERGLLLHAMVPSEGQDLAPVDTPPARRRGVKGREPRGHMDAATTELSEALATLTDEIRANNKLLRTGCSHYGTQPEVGLRRRTDRVVVEVHLAFLRIIDVDSKNALFHAEIFLEAHWEESGLSSASQEELDELNFSKIWTPRIVLINAVGEPDEVVTWYAAAKNRPGYEHPVLYMRIRTRSKFKDNLDLKHFPVDTQKLTLHVASERSTRELDLIPDRFTLPTVNVDSFNDTKEFTLWEHVTVSRNLGTEVTLDKYAESPKLRFTCHVTRRPQYHIWNSIFTQSMISALSFVAYILPPSEVSSRNSVTLALILTSVAFRITLAGDLHKTPYISYMVGFLISNLAFLVIQAIENACVAIVSAAVTPDYARTLDIVWGAVHATLFFTFNIAFALFLVIQFRKGRKELLEMEVVYQKQKERLLCRRFSEVGPTECRT